MSQTIRYELLAGRIVISDVRRFLTALDEIARSYQTIIQTVDASKIAGRQHIDYAVNKALKSFEDHSNTAQNLGVEILLQLSACRQIQKALDLGIRAGEMGVIFIVVGAARPIEETMGELARLVAPDQGLIEYCEAKRVSLMQTFGITDLEVDATGGPHNIPALIRERIALFNAFK